MNPLSINAYVCPPDMPIEGLFSMAARAGASAVGLTVRTIDEIDRRRLRSLLADHGLAVSSLNSAGYFLYEDPGASREQYERNLRLIEAAAEFKAQTLVVITGGLAHGSRALFQARERVAEGLAALAEQAARAGVHLGLEPIHPSGILNKGCIHSIHQSLASVASMANVGLTLDVFHSWWDPDLAGLVARAGSKLRLVQFSNVITLRDPADFHREVPGTGLLDVRRMLLDLAGDGYGGYFEFELFADHLRGRSPAQVIEQAARFYASLSS